MGSQLTAVPIEGDMHQLIALGIGQLGAIPHDQFDESKNYPVYLAEPLIVLRLSSLLETNGWNSRQDWIPRSVRRVCNRSDVRFPFGRDHAVGRISVARLLL